MKEQRICKHCHTPFWAIKSKQWHCSRKCFKADYFRNVQKRRYGLPRYRCQDCGKEVELRFNPSEENFFWTNFKCPFCHPDKKKVLMIVRTSKKLYIFS